MKILFLCNISLYESGPSVHLLEDIIVQCIHDGNEILLAMKDTGKRTRELTEEIRSSNSVKILTTKFINAPKGNLIKRYVQDVKYAREISKMYRLFKTVDVVFLQSCNTSAFHIHYVKKYYGSVPVVYNVQDMFPENTCAVGALDRKSVVYKLLRRIQAFSYARASKIIVISDDIKRSIESYKDLNGKVSVIYNWAYENPNKCNSGINLRTDLLGVRRDSFVVLYAGNIGVAQNVEMIIDTADLIKEYKDIVFVIVGNGSRRDMVNKMIEQKGAHNVLLIEPIAQELTEELYNSPDINIVPLHNNMIKYALPSKTARCLLSTPIVITSFDSDSEFVMNLKNSTDIINVEPNDYKELAKVVLSYYQNKLIYNNQKSVEYANRVFSKSTNVRSYCDVLYNAMN